MLRWGVSVLAVVIVAGAVGFGSVAAAAAWMVETLFYVFVLILLVMLVAGVAVGKRLV